MRGLYRKLTVDPQLRWLGPEKGILHMATGALLNAVWDLWAKAEKKPLWKLLVDLTPEQLVSTIDFSYLTDALTEEQALELLRKQQPTRAAREAEMRAKGYPAYTTSTGWLGYSDEKVRRLCEEAVAAGWTDLKMKVGQDLEANRRRAELIRSIIGPKSKLMMDANQCWDVPEAIRQMQQPGRVRSLVDRGADLARTTSSAMPPSRARWPPSAWPPARPARTASSSSSSCRRRPSASARWTAAAWAA